MAETHLGNKLAQTQPVEAVRPGPRPHLSAEPDEGDTYLHTHTHTTDKRPAKQQSIDLGSGVARASLRPDSSARPGGHTETETETVTERDRQRQRERQRRDRAAVQEVKAKMLELASERLGLRCKTPSPLLELATVHLQGAVQDTKAKEKIACACYRAAGSAVQDLACEVRCKASKLGRNYPVPAPVQLGARCKTPVRRKILLELATVHLRIAVQDNQS